MRCSKCPATTPIGPTHFREYPDHEPIIGSGVSDKYRKVFLRQVDNQRMYSRIRPYEKRIRWAMNRARRAAHDLRKSGVDIGKYVTRQPDYATTLEGTNDSINIRKNLAPVRKNRTTKLQDSPWWVTIPIAIAIGIGAALYRMNGNNSESSGGGDLYNMSESELDNFYDEPWQ